MVSLRVSYAFCNVMLHCGFPMEFVCFPMVFAMLFGPEARQNLILVKRQGCKIDQTESSDLYGTALSFFV